MALGFLDESGGTIGAQTIVGIPQYNMIVNYYLKGYTDQAALPDKHQVLMYDYVEAIYGEIVLKFKKFLVEEGENEIIVDGSWYPVRTGMGTFYALGCW